MISSSGSLIFLAAGSGSRFGSDKRQQPMAQGNSLLETSLQLYLPSYPQVVVVLRPGDETLAEQLLAARSASNILEVVFAEQAADGMGHSVACGAAALLAIEHEPYFTVALADMPYVLPSTVQRLQQVCLDSQHPFIVQPTYQGKPGNPVSFSANYLQNFTQLAGDQGARAMLQSNRDQLQRIPVDDPGVLQDIDRPNDILS